MIRLHDKNFELLIPAERIAEAVDGVARRLNADFEGVAQPPLFVGVLNGAFVFLSDLVRRLDFAVEVAFVKVSSYEGMASTGTVKSVLELNQNIEGRDVVIVEDIVDTGASIAHLKEKLKRQNPRTVRVCALFSKLPIDYAAMGAGDGFVVGYGLDYDGLGRNLKDIYVLGQ